VALHLLGDERSALRRLAEAGLLVSRTGAASTFLDCTEGLRRLCPSAGELLDRVTETGGLPVATGPVAIGNPGGERIPSGLGPK